MRANTIIMLVIALVFGGIAVFLANIWLTGQTRQPQAVTPSVETSTIVVASRDLSYGELIKPDVLREIAWPKASIPEGSFAKISELTATRRVVLTPISPSEPVLKWKISGPDARASLSALVTQGMRAVSIKINEVVGVGGFVLPGDRVDVLYTRGGSGGSSTDILIQNVRVLAVERMADAKKSEPILGNTVTVEVDTLNAQKIALAQTTGSLSLTLRAAGSLDDAPAQRVVEQELVSSPSVYQNAFDAQTAAQAQIDARLKGLEGNLSMVARQTEASKAELAAKLAALDAAIGAARNATGQGEQELRKKLAALESAISKARSTTGQGEDELRKKLAALEAAIGQVRNATGQGEEALRAKLAQFENMLQDLAASPNKPVVITPAADIAFAKPKTVTVGVTRAMTREVYQVPYGAPTYGATN